jgi:hypothetical protein
MPEIQRQRRLRGSTALVAAAACIGLAACGGSSGGSTTGTNANVTTSAASPAATTTAAHATTAAQATTTATGHAHTTSTPPVKPIQKPPANNSGFSHNLSPAVYAKLKRYAACMRSHGVPLPPPSRSGTGPIFNTSGVNLSSPGYHTAALACRRFVANLAA